MKCTNFFSPGCFYEEKTISCVSRRLLHYVSAGRTLFIGFGGDILDLTDNGRLYYAVPFVYQAVRWPKIRPFKTVIVNQEALPFANETFEVIIVNHYLEFFHKNSKFLDEVSRVLKKDGKLLVVAFNDRSFDKPMRSLKNIIKEVTESAFHLSNIHGINKKAKFLSYDFNCDQYNEILIGLFGLLADVAIMVFDRKELAVESLTILREQFEM